MRSSTRERWSLIQEFLGLGPQAFKLGAGVEPEQTFLGSNDEVAVLEFFGPVFLRLFEVFFSLRSVAQPRFGDRGDRMAVCRRVAIFDRSSGIHHCVRERSVTEIDLRTSKPRPKMFMIHDVLLRTLSL